MARVMGQRIQMNKTEIIEALRKFAYQRPGLEFSNYGDVSAYRTELRSIGRDLEDAKTLLLAVSLSGMTADELKEGFSAYSGRLTLNNDGTLDYCTGQYWPTEYRRAVCAVLASALWNYHREDYTNDAKGSESKGDAVRRNFRRRFGKRIQSRWFD